MTSQPWKQDGFADAYNPSVDPITLKPMVRHIELSTRATQEVFDQFDPTDEEAFALIGFDGMLRAEGHMYQSLDNALRVAMEENLLIFYCKTGRAFRIVWQEDQLPQRTEMNYDLEDVILEPDVLALDEDRLFQHKKLRQLFKGFTS